MPLSNAEKSKRYRERHPERFRASLLKYWKTKYECECGKTLTKKNRAVHLRGAEHKKYADYMEMKRKINYIEQQEEFAEKSKELTECECGTRVSYAHLARHKKTNKHIKEMEIKNKIEENEVKQMNQELEDMFSETSSEEEEYINNYLSNGKYDKEGLVITTDSDTED